MVNILNYVNTGARLKKVIQNMKLSKYMYIICSAVLIIVMSGMCISDYIYVGEHYEIERNVVETDKFRNPKMNETSLYQIKKFAVENHLDFSKIVATALVISDFNLNDFDVKSIKIRRYNRIYKKLNKDKDSLEYFDKINSILKNIKCFPVVCDKDNRYEFAYEDTYGEARSFNGNYQHEGTDIMAKTNRSGVYPIVSVCDGVVENVGWLPKGGYRVGIRGAYGGYFYYAHLQQGSILVKEKTKIKAGQIIGYMGDTGYGKEGTTGKFPVHLHFGIYISTENHEELAVNPYYILKYLENYCIKHEY